LKSNDFSPRQDRISVLPRRHATSLQDIDLINQTLGDLGKAIASILSSESRRRAVPVRQARTAAGRAAMH
jgi:hypothetical protein